MKTQKKTSRANKFLDWDLLRRVIALALPFKRLFIAAVFLALLLALLGPLRPYLVQLTIDQHILLGDYTGLVRMSLLLVGMLLLEAFCQYNFIFFTNRLGQSVIKNLRVKVFERILQFRLRYFDTTPIGTATTRAINDVETVNDIFSEGFISIVADMLTILTVLIMMMYSDYRLALMSLLTFPFLIWVTYYFKEGVKKTSQSVRTQVARLNAFLQEHISGMSVVQLFAAEQYELAKFKAVNAEYRRANIDAIWYYSIFFPFIEVLIACSQGLLVWYGANLVIGHKASLGMLVAFIMYINILFRPVRMLADKFNTLQMGLVAAERVFAQLDLQEFIPNKGKLQPSIRGQIEFQNVWFAYNGIDYILRDVSFLVQPGQTLALVGATGAGKSSIINILNRFYDIQKGTIRLDEQLIADYEITALRRQIGLVLQDVFLFSGSIFDNIVLRNHSISREQVIQAAKMVGAHDFIMQLPGQYDYNVMERGATLSLGQRQLISFIRALVFNPAILILDEATSSIDTETEEMVQHAINTLVRGRTSIIIAHRLSTIQHADKIIVLDKGQILERGTHTELLAHGGYYKKLYDTQFANL